MNEPGRPSTGGDSPLRILVFCYEYPPLGGGGGIGAQKYAEAWAAQGHDVLVVTGGGSDLPHRESVRGVDVVRVRNAQKKDRATASFSFMGSYLVAGALYVLRNRGGLRSYDVINTHFSIPTGPLGWFASRVLGLPHVLTIIGGDIYDPTKRTSPHRFGVLRAANRFLTSAADRVIAISSDTASRAEELHGVQAPITVINYGFDPEGMVQPHPEGNAEPDDGVGPFRLVAVGRLVRRKGFDHLIDALGRLPGDVQLTIVGDGPEESELRRRAVEVGVADRVELAGFLSPEDVVEQLASADCYVLSSIHEGLGIVVQEAMYAGLPIVATNVGGQTDLLAHGRNALLVPPGDSGALAAAILELKEDRDLARRMGRTNQKDLEPHYMDENARLYIEEFRKAIGGVPASPLTPSSP